MADELWPKCACICLGEGQAGALTDAAMTIARVGGMNHVQACVQAGMCDEMTDSALAMSSAFALTASQGDEPIEPEAYAERLEKFIRKLRVAALVYSKEENYV